MNTYNKYNVVRIRNHPFYKWWRFILDNNQVISNEEAYEMAKQGKLEGVVGAEREGTKYIRGINDGDESNNLDNLPEFE